jgi:Flp pilus assembly protein TadG
MNLKTKDRWEGKRKPRLRRILSRGKLTQAAAGEEPVGPGGRRVHGEEGAALVEMALASIVMLAMLFGIIEMSLAIYTYTFVSDAAREATRYAIVRGPDSCTISPTFPNCNLSGGSAGNPLQTYVRSLTYPGVDPSRLSVAATWLVASGTLVGSGSTGYTTTSWPNACAGGGAFDTGTGLACNNVGNAVRVVVSYQFPLSIPFWRATTLNISSTSQMVISE